MKPLVLTSFALLYCLLLPAQAPALYFEKISTENGLSNNTVNVMLHDQRGFMWIGTNDGLNRFDGHNFAIFRNRPGDKTSLGGNIITALLEDAQQVLWIATADGGLTRYDYRLASAQQFKPYKHLPGDSTTIPTNNINTIVQDKQGFLWLGTSGFGLVRFNPRTERFDRPVKVSTRTVLSLCFDAQGLLWVGRQGGGLMMVNTQTNTSYVDPRYANLYSELPHVVVTSLYCDAGKNMWYGSWDKYLYQSNPGNTAETRFGQSGLPGSFINDEVNCFAEDRQGYLWIGGKSRGLQLRDKKTGVFYSYQHDPRRDGSLSDNNIHCLCIAPSGKTWIGTDKGICTSSPAIQQFTQTFLLQGVATQNPVTIYDFYTTPANELWIGTSNGIYTGKTGSNSFTHLPLRYKGTPLAVTKFFRASNGQFYLGTNYSLFRYFPDTRSIALLPNTEKDGVLSKLISSRIVSITEDTIDHDPVLLVSPYGHYLAYYNLRTQAWVSRLDTTKKILKAMNIADNLVRKLYKGDDGRIWMANAQMGLGQWRSDTQPEVLYYQNNPSAPGGLSNNNVYDITADAEHKLWISTYGGGLHQFDPATKTITHIPAASNLLEGIQADHNGNVWMISNGHLQQYNVTTRSMASFTLPDLEKSGGVSGDIYQDHRGLLYVAGKNYFIAFHPDSIHTDRPRPAVYFTDFRVFNESRSNLLVSSTIGLSYRQNYFTIEFAAPDYNASQPVQYAYQLEGFDKDWVECGTRNFAPYANLEGGTYTFRIRASNTPGTWQEKAERLTIIITPPIWKRWWFYLLCVLLLSGIGYTLYRYRINELLKRQAIRNKIAQDLHDSVGSTLSSISVYSQVAQIQSAQDSKVALNEVLGKISTTSNDMITEMNDIVWAINPRNDSVEKIVHRMESFARPLLAARNIRFDFQYDPGVLSIYLDMEKRKNFYLIFKEAITNVIKYSGASELLVRIQVQRHVLTLLVQDNGVGFSLARETRQHKPSLSGNGLHNMQVRAKEMKGTLDIESTTGVGTCIRLQCSIP